MLLGVARLVNFAHGQLYMLGAFVDLVCDDPDWACHYPLAVLLAIVALAVAGRSDAERDDAAW